MPITSERSFSPAYSSIFRAYITEGSLEDHILNMQYTWTWGTQVELYAVASLFQKEIYTFTPTLQKDGTYTWIKIPPYPPHVELVFPPRDEPWLRLLDKIDQMELCHTFGNHYDVVQSADGFYSLLKPALGIWNLGLSRRHSTKSIIFSIVLSLIIYFVSMSLYLKAKN